MKLPPREFAQAWLFFWVVFLLIEWLRTGEWRPFWEGGRATLAVGLMLALFWDPHESRSR